MEPDGSAFNRGVRLRRTVPSKATGEPSALNAGTRPAFKSDARARAEVGVLLASTVREQLEGEGPLCRWLLAHRRDFHGDLRNWLDDVLSEARRDGREVEELLPFKLSSTDRFHAWRLPLLGAPPPGDDRIDEPMRARNGPEWPRGRRCRRRRPRLGPVLARVCGLRCQK